MPRWTIALLALALTLLAGCAPIPTPIQAVQPVQTRLPAGAGQPPAPPAAAQGPQPHELWSRSLLGTPGHLIMAADASRIVALSGTGPDRATALSGGGQVLWSFAPEDQQLAGVDLSLDGRKSVFVGWVKGSGGAGRLYTVNDDGAVQRLFAWNFPWARYVHLSEDGGTIALGFDGTVGSSDGVFMTLNAKGDTLFKQAALRMQFLGYPSADGSLVLMGYRGNPGGLIADPNYPGTGVRMFTREGHELWHIIDYHRPLGLAADGTVAVVAGEPEGDGAYKQPPGVEGSPPAFGQLLWYGARDGRLLGRYALPYKAGIYRFVLSADGKHAAVSLISYQFKGEKVRSQEQVLLFGAAGQLHGRIDPDEPVRDVVMSRDGRYLLLLTTPDLALAGASDLTLYDENGQVVWRYHSPAGVISAGLSGDGSRLAYTAADGHVHLLDTGVH